MMDMILHKLMLFINGAQEGSTHRNLAIELVKHIDELKDLNIYEIAEYALYLLLHSVGFVVY